MKDYDDDKYDDDDDEFEYSPSRNTTRLCPVCGGQGMIEDVDGNGDRVCGNCGGSGTERVRRR